MYSTIACLSVLWHVLGMKYSKSLTLFTIVQFITVPTIVYYSVACRAQMHWVCWNCFWKPEKCNVSKNPSFYNVIHWFAGPMGQMTHRPSIWCSKCHSWNVRQSVDEWFVPLSQRTNVLYCRLSDFKSFIVTNSIQVWHLFFLSQIFFI